jgi:SAM-dependent methyltransferase
MTTTSLDIGTVLAYLGLALIALGGFWVIIPRIYGAPGTPTPAHLIRKALQLADVQPGEKVYDLGAGDGRIVVAAARQFKARAVGIEIEPVHCLIAWLRALLNGVVLRVSIRQENLFKADMGDADVVFVYLTPELVGRLRPQLILKLRPGARVVSLYFPFAEWQPAQVDIGNLIFFYQMPPQPGSVDTFLRERMSDAF